MKIIFSRKGWDSGIGGKPSPIMPDGQMISLPIPSYDQTNFGHLLNKDGEYISPMIEDLSKRKTRRHHSCHLDPDLKYESAQRDYPKSQWQAGFGQAGAALSHLKSNNVQKGDLFLFFGWARDVEYKNDHWQYIPKTKDKHVLFGWMMIEDCLDVHNDTHIPENLKYHPHSIKERRDRNLNAIYTAQKNLSSIGLPDIEGSGTFEKVKDNHILTAPDMTRSFWKVPTWMIPEGNKPALTYHSNPERWSRLNKEEALLKLVARGQEFILDLDHYPEGLSWIKELFN